MYEHWPEMLGIISTVIAVIFFFLRYISNQITINIQNAIKPLDEKIDREIADVTNNIDTMNKRFDGECVKKDKSINAVGERLTSRIKDVESNVVYKDVFDQHAKIEDERAESTKQMISLIQEQMKSTSTANTAEHARICGKLDAMPSIINEAIQLANKK